MSESMDIQDTLEPPSTPGTAGRTAAKVDDVRPEPSPATLARLEQIVSRSQRRSGVAFGEGFVRRRDDATAPPLARMLRGGQGGEVRLKLYLTMSLLATNPPYDIKGPIPARAWAEALGLPVPDRNGARRVNDAIDWLHQHRFLVSDRRPGAPGGIQLLSQTGSGEPFSRPTGATRYVQLPLGLWLNGWIVRLSGAALALLIILLDLQGGRAGPQTIAPSQAGVRYDLSPDTWTKGIRELKHFGIVEVSRRPQGDIWDYRRMRNAYWVNIGPLQGESSDRPRPRARRRNPRRIS